MTAETRRFTFCFLSSLLLNAAALVLTAWLWQPLDTLPAILHPRMKLVTLALRPPKPIVKTIVRPVPIKVSPKKPTPPKKRLRPGTHVHTSQPAPAAAPSGGLDAGAPAPAAVPLPTPAPMIVAAARPAPRLVHNPIMPAKPVTIPAPATVAAPALVPPVITPKPPAIAAGNGAGGGAVGKGVGKGEGTGQNRGAGAGKSADAGEPFGIGQGMAGDGAPRHVVYVLDISGSMTSRIGRAEEELRRALNGLGSEETFNIVVFSDDVATFTSGMARATPDRVRQASDYLSTLHIEGGTDLEDAMTTALSLPDVNEVVVLTDGVPTVGETDFPTLARLIRRRNRTHARISAVGMVGKNPDGTDDSFEAAKLLEQIARDSGGTAKVVTLGVATPE